MNHKKSFSFSPLLDFTEIDQEDEEFKFDLYLQSRKVKQISQTLLQAMEDGQSQQTAWIIRNQSVINSLLNDLLDDSMLVLDGLDLDDEAINLSLGMMSDIRNTLDIVERIIHHQDMVE